MSDDVINAENDTYWAFVFNLIKQHLSGTPPTVLWHYTSGAALIDIIKSGTLYATQIACVNDTTEFRYSIELLKDAFARRRRTATNPAEVALVDYILANISTETVTNEWFVTCFSKRRDDLSQWRAYSGGENGYAIGLDAHALLPSLRLPDFYLGPVNYYTTLHVQVVDAVAAATVQFFLQGLAAPARTVAGWTQSFLTKWVIVIGYIAPVIKHPAFKDEEEWRIFHPLQPSDPPHMVYRQKRTLMSRHLPLRFFRPGVPDNPKLMPITEIMVGPSRHKSITRVSVGDLMRTQGYGASLPVSMSDVPFQET
jgi:hypothetical protein